MKKIGMLGCMAWTSSVELSGSSAMNRAISSTERSI